MTWLRPCPSGMFFFLFLRIQVGSVSTLSQYQENDAVSDHGASNGEGFIKIGPVVSEHCLICNDFWGVLDQFGPLGVDQSKNNKKCTVSDHGASNGEGFIKISPVVSEHGLCFYGGLCFWTNLVRLVHSEWTDRQTKRKTALIPVLCYRMVKELSKSVQ